MEIAFKSRVQLGDFLNQKGLTGRGVEVGVFKGEFSRVMLETWKGQKLYLVDVWRELDNYVDTSNQKDFLTSHKCLSMTLANVFPFKERAVIIREDSREAANFFADGSLDFVYIDAAHDYINVMKDLETWLPKVKKGGVFCGHDFLDMKAGTPGWVHGEFEVERAVKEFAKQKGLGPIKVTDEPFATWIIEL